MNKLITLNNSGDKFLDEIFNDLITVYEDIQGSKIIVRYDGKGFEFRTKSINNDPISLVDISLQKYYNKAINFFHSLDEHVLALMNKRWHFVFEYFPDNEPAHIKYNRPPKNSLILTSIIKGNNKHKYSVEEILEFSNLFNCDPLPIIFHGKLNQKQKEGIKYFLHTSKDDLEYVFGDKSFTFFFYKLLDPTHKHSFLMDNEFQDNVEKLIIRTHDNDYRYELLNPLYEKNSDTIKTDFTDIYTLILLNFLSYLQNVDIKDISLSGNKKDSIYINLICKLYNMYMNDTSEELMDFEFDIPKFFNKEKFKINIDFIDNQLTKTYISKSDRFEYIFKCILGSFRKKKSKSVGIFTDNSLTLFNNYIDLIEDQINLHLNKIKEDQLRNSQLMDYDDYQNINYDTDADGKVYPDVYTEFISGDDGGKGKKMKKFSK